MKTPKTISQLVSEVGLTMQATPMASRSNVSEWSKDASHWSCVLTRGSASMSVEFSQGSAHRRWSKEKLAKYYGTYTKDEIAKLTPRLGDRGLGGAPETIALRELREQCIEPTPPELESVLDCLASDASTYENARGFSDWCAELGYDDDSVKAKKTYDTCAEQAKQLRHLLGKEAFDELLYNVERL